MLRVLILSFLTLSITSCGLKITTEVDDNVLIGTWELQSLRCYLPASDTFFVENYEIANNNHDVTIQFTNQSIQYTVSSGVCTTSATGVYKTDFDGDGKGEMDIVNVLSASTCDIPVAFTGNGSGAGTGTINFALLATDSRNLDWNLESNDRDKIYIDFYTGFPGSDDNSFCDAQCTCVGEYDKI